MQRKHLIFPMLVGEHLDLVNKSPRMLMAVLVLALMVILHLDNLVGSTQDLVMVEVDHRAPLVLVAVPVSLLGLVVVMVVVLLVLLGVQEVLHLVIQEVTKMEVDLQEEELEEMVEHPKVDQVQADLILDLELSTMA